MAAVVQHLTLTGGRVDLVQAVRMTAVAVLKQVVREIWAVIRQLKVMPAHQVAAQILAAVVVERQQLAAESRQAMVPRSIHRGDWLLRRVKISVELIGTLAAVVVVLEADTVQAAQAAMAAVVRDRLDKATVHRVQLIRVVVVVVQVTQVH
jgi:hypothetical protein